MSQYSWADGSGRVECSPPFPCCPVNRYCLWMKTLIEKLISNDEMKDIIRIIKSLEDSGLLPERTSETIQNEAKE